MDKEAIDIIRDHKNPLTKFGLIGSKLFLKDSNPLAQQLISTNLENLGILLQHQKVEKRCSRAKAQWQPALNLAKVDKVVKGLLEHFGYQDKNGIYMYPEEMLFLMETNRMEIALNELPLSIQECYDIVLNTPEMDLNKYRVYKKLVLQGYRVIRFGEIIRRKNSHKKVEEKDKKRKIESTKNDTSENKKSKSIVDISEQVKNDKNLIYQEIKKNAPQSYIPINVDSNPDFCLFLSNNSSRVNWDFNLYICKNYVLDELKTDHPSIYAICSGDNISLYKIGTVNLPSNIYT